MTKLMPSLISLTNHASFSNQADTMSSVSDKSHVDLNSLFTVI